MVVVSLVLFAACAAIFVLVWRWSVNGRLVATPFLVFGGYEIVFVWPSTVNAQLLRQPVGLYATFAVGLAFVFFLAGFVGAAHVARIRAAASMYVAHELGAHVDRHDYKRVLVASLVVLIVLSAYLYRGTPPLIAAIWAVIVQGASLVSTVDAFALERFDITKSYYFGGEYRGQGIVLTAMQVSSLFLTGFALAAYWVKRTRWRLAACLGAVALSLVLVGGAGQREQAVQVLVYVIVVLSLLGGMNLRHVLGGAMAILVVSLALSALNNQVRALAQAQDPVGYLVQSVVARVLLGNGLENLSIIELVDEGRLTLGLGAIHLQTLHNAVPFIEKLEPFSYRLFTLLHPGVPGTVFETSTYFGMLYADFGFVGPLVGYLLLGGMTAFAQRLLFSLPRDILSAPLVALIVLYVGTISRDNPISMGASIAVAFAWYTGMRLLTSRRKVRVVAAPLFAEGESLASYGGRTRVSS